MKGFDALEERLARLKAAKLPDEFMARLAATRPRPASRERREPTPWPTVLPMQWFWIPAGAAFALLVAVLLTRHPAPPRQETRLAAANAPKEVRRVFVPSHIDKYLLEARDVGTAADAQGRAYRLVRCAWIDRETYREDRGESRLQIVKAKEQIVPVALDIY